MIRILWLDDEPELQDELAESLRLDGISVSFVRTEDAAERWLEEGPLPDVFVQDVYRPPRMVVPTRTAQGTDLPRDLDAAGWVFYRDVLFERFPQLPVVVVSVSADWPESRRVAEDFNLTILPKRPGLRESLVSTIQRILQSSHMLVAPKPFPAIIGVDFEKINGALLKHLAKHPMDLENISWSGFEELIARLLRELGYEVARTPLTRDGGVDLWALERSDLGEILYAIDTKKYSRSRVIGPEPVRAIYGVADLEHASVGMIVTTAAFGPAARQMAIQYRYRVALRDFDDVVAWIKRVDFLR